MDNSIDRVEWDTPAAAAYIKAAGQAATLLGTAKDHADTVAGIDLSGLGTLGKGFAAAWAAAWGGHSDQLGTASQLTDGYGQGIDTWGKVLGGVDTDNAATIAGAVPGTDEIQA
ncbi:hypothetical protein D7D52_35910 [Nocardia yunnanensis]|uniref:WXG100 family type VII secretion target n=1 Tax=Nocardia yunnanensis TaxID=2382165 RepID=A0A386ZLJ4_9NOCA|nr:hypothetical protein [Nocardia yunnanensis]AYF78326.1 hypothetical protein D7D52_35910 [Nocardia yunnanensis]